MTQIVERATDLQFRIWAEFRTMPGLRLTRNQACRLFGGESNKVVEALQDLVDAAVLRQIGPYYVRADIGSFTA
jgi:nicotinate-nucleotide pyrophosphorylase